MGGKGKLTVKLSDATAPLAATKASLSAIDAGKKQSLSLNLGVPAEVGGGSYSLKACAKPPKGTKDADKKDNCKTLSPVEIPAVAPDQDPAPDPDPNPNPGPAPDTNAPETTITSGPVEGVKVNDNDPSFQFSSSEPGSGFECKLDAAAFTACASPRAFTDIAEGLHTFAVRATDAAGNVDATPATRSWTVDTVPSLFDLDLTEDCLYATNPPGAQLGLVTLDLPAIGDTPVELSSTNTNVVAVPPSVTVPSGMTSATVTGTVVTAGTANIEASLSGTTLAEPFEVRTVGDPEAIESLRLNPTSVPAGAQTVATVRLDCTAPASGTSVHLTTSDPSIIVNTPLMLAAGTRSGTAAVQTSALTPTGPHAVSANLGGPATIAGFTVTAP